MDPGGWTGVTGRTVQGQDVCTGSFLSYYLLKRVFNSLLIIISNKYRVKAFSIIQLLGSIIAKVNFQLLKTFVEWWNKKKFCTIIEVAHI